MLKAHLQAWIWQDEWHGLTMEVGKGKKYKKNFDIFLDFFREGKRITWRYSISADVVYKVKGLGFAEGVQLPKCQLLPDLGFLLPFGDLTLTLSLYSLPTGHSGDRG